jgi:glycerophosphoryl diester phosphodiesterase
MLVQVEIKKGAEVAPVLRAIRSTRTARNVILASFEHAILREAGALAPSIPRMLIADPEPPSARPAEAGLRWARAAMSLGAAGISLNHRSVVSDSLVAAIQDRGLSLWCWTVNGRRAIRRLSKWGVDALILDDPRNFTSVFKLTPL